MVLAFFENERRQIREVVDYAKNYIYQTDDLLDMKLGDMATPGEDPGHLVLAGFRWICYFLVDHPNYGRCHYFQIKPDELSGRLPDKDELEYIVMEFGIDRRPLLDKHITIDKEAVKIILPLVS